MKEGERGSRSINPIMGYFSDIPDQRKEINKKYPQYEIVAITIKHGRNTRGEGNGHGTKKEEKGYYRSSA